MDYRQQIKKHASAATREQLSLWVDELQAKTRLTELDATRLNIFGHELTLRPVAAEMPQTLGELGLYDDSLDDGRATVTRPEHRRDADFWTQVGRATLLILCMLAFPFLGGCTSTNTVLRVAVNIDVTDIVYGCDRKRDFACGRPGSRDMALVELIYAPGLRLDRPLEPYSSWLHQSGVAAGRPFNDRPDQVIDSLCGGVFVQFGDRR
jgi:hypothetical protein